MDIDGLNVAVVGGGIGGLTAALAMRAHGAQVAVYERAEALTEVGAGLQISPNGFAVLRALGLGETLAERAVRARAVTLQDYRSGKRVMHLDLKRLPAEHPYFFVHRADLIDILADAVRSADIALHLGNEVTGYRSGGPVFETARGDVSADLVIGAEGLHSPLRSQLNGTLDPFFTGQVAWRAVVPNTIGHPAHARVTMGPGRHVVTYPLRGGDLVNIVAVQERHAWVEEGWTHQDDPKNLMAAFADFGPETHAVLERVEDVGLWGLFRHPVAPRWHGPGLVLLGDAAHPTLPFLAQGANMALEDAWVLAASVANHGLAGGLADYQSRRVPRVTRIVDAATRNAWKYHLRFPPLRLAAHTVMRIGSAIAPRAFSSQYDWIYLHDVTST